MSLEPVARCAPPYPEVRALERGLKLLEALAELGWSTPSTLSAHTGIDRTTIYRLLSTLVRAGYVAARPEDGSYVLSARIRQIASGAGDDFRTIAASPVLEDLVREILWPSDFAVAVGGRMRIMASSHHLTSMTFFRALVGKERPILTSALGRAALAAMTPDELELALMAISADGARPVPPSSDDVRRVLDETRAVGYAAAAGTVYPKISAIALPVLVRAHVVGAVNIVFFRSALSTARAAERYLGALRAAVSRIEQALSDRDSTAAQRTSVRAANKG